MKVRDIVKRLKEMPEDATVCYKHNSRGSIEVEEIALVEGKALNGNTIVYVILEGAKEE